MLKHHEESIELLKEYYRTQEGVIAIVLGGSVSKGEERPDSDLDAMIVLEDEAYAKRLQTGALAECISGKCTYPEGYFDTKFFNLDYLKLAAKQGSDPTRNSFLKSKILYSNVPELPEIIEGITTYPVQEKQERIEKFYSILMLASGYFFRDSLRSGDLYLLNKSCFETVYAGLRMLYTYNEVFFASHKRLIEYAERLPQKPDTIVALAKELNLKKDWESREAFVKAILDFSDWSIDKSDVDFYIATYVKNLEQTWQFSPHNIYEL